MEAIFSSTTKTGDIVTQLPAASGILKEYRIDFCCGGNRPIGEAIKEKQLNEQEVLNKLNLVYANTQNKQEKNWKDAPYSQLIDHIINMHHAYLNAVLPEISGYVTKVLRVHGRNHPELKEVHQLFHNLKLELEQHTIQEETDTFPLIKQYEKSRSASLLKILKYGIGDLETEHETAGFLLKRLREVTRDYQTPEGACMTYQLTYNKLEELEADLFEHIHLENNILFPALLKEDENSAPSES
ncbi:iron-sulfur cluster repair di-iron protein [Pseudalkalibacillus caeni]|uniref:Iron-sulfur cluster repair di-iron protein n=1 Tax=Exobacillus caeni TaxID=2574798 RepID=A0A5R9F5Y6_9BACL|nr:iron-sulfur cluster repair di-iron protein [Pseudalkalibacillus caeni]TLS38957.1 iron-sulfur cluster repair di-iron protein [Pseudalkalibacillus caeni]